MTAPDVAPAVDRRTLTHIDVIGDVHGCLDELLDLLRTLEYAPDAQGTWRHADRTAVFVGDLVDRGPNSAGVLKLVMPMVAAGAALAVPGNHDLYLEDHLRGLPAPMMYGLIETMAEFDRETESFSAEVLAFLRSLPSHYVLDEGRLVVAHTGLAEEWHGQESRSLRRLAANGVTHGVIDARDPTKRHKWVRDYRGAAAVVYGHTSVLEPEWLRNTIDIDTGCVFGWRLTALRWPERSFVSVEAREIYAEIGRPFLPRSAMTRSRS
jgi:diadenosine tetraphosphatase ApaH/serine/threonine PP2A family protein phosphatase